MSSGEILFILAFIVLPTAVLVSSVWAVLFVRRQPERVADRTGDETLREETGTSEQLDVVVDTVVLPTVGRAHTDQLTEPDDADDEEPSDADRDSASEPDTQLVDADILDETSQDRFDEHQSTGEGPEQEAAHDSSAQDDLEQLQATDDLNDVVSGVKAQDVQEQEEHIPPISEEDDDTGSDARIYETTDLPVMERPGEQRGTDETEPRPVEPQPDVASDVDDVDERDPQATSGSRWRRRKRPAPLRPSDPDAGRARGRNRDPQRQVPQLGRTSRRRDGNPRDTSPDSEEDQSDKS